MKFAMLMKGETPVALKSGASTGASRESKSKKCHQCQTPGYGSASCSVARDASVSEGSASCPLSETVVDGSLVMQGTPHRCVDSLCYYSILKMWWIALWHHRID